MRTNQCVVGSLLMVTIAAGISRNFPTLKLIAAAPVPMILPTEDTAFEGGTVLRTAAGLHLFTTDISNGVANTSLVYYHATDARSNFTFVRNLGNSTGLPGDPKGSLWAPMPAWDVLTQRWQLYYVQYYAWERARE